MRLIPLVVSLLTLMPLVARAQTTHVSDDQAVRVAVIGEVAHPGRYDLKSCTTVLDAVALAGGFTEFASRQRIVLLRPEPASKRIPFAIWESPPRGQQNLCLRRGDMLLVP
jgi:polysaccharide export outer membrane protein